mmetsp:Transcript_60222/g.141839  ORF Transcript_60222/g.141839 Transcript_60222/m.141839 type:complete len:91 (-) Transcript_60222:181-453(-)
MEVSSIWSIDVLDVRDLDLRSLQEDLREVRVLFSCLALPLPSPLLADDSAEFDEPREEKVPTHSYNDCSLRNCLKDAPLKLCLKLVRRTD